MALNTTKSNGGVSYNVNKQHFFTPTHSDLSRFVSLCLFVFSLSEEIDIAFVMNATSDSANEAFQLMKKIAKYVMEEKNNHQMKYQVVVHGEDSSSTGICFDDDPVPDVRTLSDRVDRLMRNVEVNIPALHEDLEKVCEAFEQGNQRPNSEKVGTNSMSKRLIYFFSY